MARRPLDFYETPAHYVEQLLARVSIKGRIFEPCVGDGAISRFVSGPRSYTNDINPNCAANYHFDAARSWPLEHHYDWIITNPPFNLAYFILQQCLNRATQVALLLRISFFEPTKQREQFLVDNPPSGLIYLPRYSFTANGKSDMATVCWAVWGYPMDPPIQIAPRFPHA